MNFALSDEQVLLRESARGTLARFKTIEAAREALEDSTALPDLWATTVEAGWPGLLIGEQSGGAGLGTFDALLVAEECGRVLAPVPLLGLLPATAILEAAGDQSLAAVAAGDLRPVYLPARPPSELRDGGPSNRAQGSREGAPRARPGPRGGARRHDRLRARRAGSRSARGDRGKRGRRAGRGRGRRGARRLDRGGDALRRVAAAGARHVHRGRRPASGGGSGRARHRVVSRPRSDRRRVARCRARRVSRSASPTPRSASRLAGRSAHTRRSSMS